MQITLTKEELLDALTTYFGEHHETILSGPKTKVVDFLSNYSSTVPQFTLEIGEET